MVSFRTGVRTGLFPVTVLYSPATRQDSSRTTGSGSYSCASKGVDKPTLFAVLRYPDSPEITACPPRHLVPLFVLPILLSGPASPQRDRHSRRQVEPSCARAKLNIREHWRSLACYEGGKCRFLSSIKILNQTATTKFTTKRQVAASCLIRKTRLISVHIRRAMVQSLPRRRTGRVIESMVVTTVVVLATRAN